MIVKTDRYTRDEVGKFVQMRASVERLKLGEGVTDRLAAEGDKSSLRYGLCLAFMPVPIMFAPRYPLEIVYFRTSRWIFNGLARQRRCVRLALLRLIYSLINF